MPVCAAGSVPAARQGRESEPGLAVTLGYRKRARVEKGPVAPDLAGSSLRAASRLQPLGIDLVGSNPTLADLITGGRVMLKWSLLAIAVSGCGVERDWDEVPRLQEFVDRYGNPTSSLTYKAVTVSAWRRPVILRDDGTPAGLVVLDKGGLVFDVEALDLTIQEPF